MIPESIPAVVKNNEIRIDTILRELVIVEFFRAGKPAISLYAPDPLLFTFLFRKFLNNSIGMNDSERGIFGRIKKRTRSGLAPFPPPTGLF